MKLRQRGARATLGLLETIVLSHHGSPLVRRDTVRAAAEAIRREPLADLFGPGQMSRTWQLIPFGVDGGPSIRRPGSVRLIDARNAAANPGRA